MIESASQITLDDFVETVQRFYQMGSGLASTGDSGQQSQSSRLETLRQYQLLAERLLNLSGQLAKGYDTHREVELELQTSHKTLQSFMDAITESALLMDADGTLLAVNRTVTERLNLQPEQAVGHSIYSMIPPEVADGRREHVSKVLETKVPLQFIDERLGRIIENTIYPVKEEDGRITRLAIVGVDVTERERLGEQLKSSERRLREILDNIPIPVAVNTLEDPAHISYLNKQFVRAYGYTLDDIPTTDVWSAKAYPDPEYRNRMMGSWFEELEKARQGGGTVAPREISITCKDGSSRHVLIGGNLIADTLIVSLVDISDRKKLEDELAERSAFLEALLGNIDAHIYMKDRQGRFLFANQKVLDNFHVTPNDIIGHVGHDFLPKAVADSFQTMDEQVFQTQRTLSAEERMQDTEGNETNCWSIKVPVQISTGKEALIGFSTDITELRQLQKKLDRQLVTDELTGMLNRISIHERTSQALEDATSHRRKIGFMVIGLDRFRFVNDTLGHDCGDKVLIEVAKRIDACLPTKAPLARLSGDQFAVLLPSMESGAEAASLAQLIQQKFSAPIPVAGDEIVMTASIGIAMAPNDGRSAEILLQNAETAMYHVKSRARGTFEFFSSELGTAISKQLELERDLRSALRGEQFQIHYQPIITTADGSISRVEALIRWNHPDRGFVSPATFIPLAEEIGLIESIGEWVISEACSQLLSWKADGLADIIMSINVSAAQLRSPHFGHRLSEIVNQFDLEPKSLELEITETVVMSNPDIQIRQIQDLAALGFGISIDDFGTGYSSLAYIQKLPVGTLKIDRSFVQDIDSLPAQAALCRAIIALAHSLDLRTVAEGVETEAQQRSLTEWGCDYLQGYLFGSPMSATALAPTLRRRNIFAPVT